MPSDVTNTQVAGETAAAPAGRHVQVETVAWVTRFVGGTGSDRIGFELVMQPGETVRHALQRLSERFPQLRHALWDAETGELGEHIEVVVNGAILGIHHSLDSELRDGDRILLFGQYMGG
jgi:molybdopterin converting factor small subunit